MLPEFEAGATGRKAGEETDFDLHFPEDYQGREVAGKTARFHVRVQKVEMQQLPEVNTEFATELGVPDGDVAKLRDDIRRNLEREVKARLSSRNRNAAMEALLKVNPVDLPAGVVAEEIDNLIRGAREDLAARGMKDVDKLPIAPDMFRDQAERRVRLGLIVAELVKENELHAKPEQIRAHVENLASSYEDPQEVVRWYYGDQQRLSQVESIVIENNVADYVFEKARVTDKALGFDELMQSN